MDTSQGAKPFVFVDPRYLVEPGPYQPVVVPPPHPTDAWYAPFAPVVEHVARIKGGSLVPDRAGGGD